MKLSKKTIDFAAFFFHFWYSDQISNVLRKNMGLIGQVFLKLLAPKHVVISMHNRSSF